MGTGISLRLSVSLPFREIGTICRLRRGLGVALLYSRQIEPYMDEAFLKQAFAVMGETCLSTKIITNKLTGLPLGYGFLEFIDEHTAQRILLKCDGKPIPGSNPAPGEAAVVLDESGKSRGYGFVRFGNQEEHQQALEIMNGFEGLGGKALRGYQQYYAGYQGYQGYPGYYGQQPEYPQHTDPSAVAHTGYEDAATAAAAVPHGPNPPLPQTAPPAPESDNEVEDHDMGMPDVEASNKLLLARSEDLYSAFDSSRWLPTEGLDPPLVSVK
ncbi:hypothetical protein HPB52_024346 [Rhipicephalus sanguineus]|uniref:tRNA selenocysteine 1-associated protein 1 n=1 Tax=Rhipicephalus sanguineus TaxID=34632 RepID=A0A9D4YR66_RHISA|nr:hypothetical protein HPB52_024346 [Rhipicephalus sanguineus]